ncbi:MAG: UDP-N-acetylglucosamine 2-epimerase [Chthoniobacterales bacterium]
MKNIGIVTVARSDYGIYRSLLQRLSEDSHYQPGLFVTGAHLSPDFGMTVREIEKDKFPIQDRIEMLSSHDSPEAITKAMGVGIEGFSHAYAKNRPDLLFVLGDRFEMFAATAAAVPFNIPIAHLHGGELTAGAIDDVFRHSITKMSHLHFTATQEYANRVIQLGEDPSRVVVSGAPGLDGLETFEPLSKEELETRFSLKLDLAPLLVTFHPVTLEYEDAGRQTEMLLAALADFNHPVIFTAPNADTAGRAVRECILRFVEGRNNTYFVENFGRRAYFSVIPHCSAMVGNSSSGIIEALSFKLPVVNIGTRQAGRTRGANVIDVPCDKKSILDATRKSTSADFRKSLATTTNPYRPHTRDAAEIIVESLAKHDGGNLIQKHFYDLPVAKK